MRRTPVVTRYSAVRCWPSVVHWPPLLRTARSRTIGTPPSTAYRARNSEPPCPVHETTSRSCSMPAVRPVIALYCETSHLSGSASDVLPVNSVNAAAIQTRIVMPSSLTASKGDCSAEARHSSRHDARRETELGTGQAVDGRDAARVQRVEHLEIQLDVLALADPEPLGRLDRDDLHRRRRVLAVLSHPQRDRSLPQHGRRPDE